MLLYCIVEVNFLDVNHEVLGAWGWCHSVPIHFGGGEVGCWGGDWFLKCECFSSQCESRSVRLFLLGQNVADNAAIYDLYVLVEFLPVDGKTIVSSVYVL